MFRRSGLRGPAVICLLAALAACSGGGEVVGPVPGTTVEAIDRLVSDYIEAEGIPGATAAIVRDGKLVFARAYGFADLARTEPMEPDALFRVASVSKPITGISVLKAVDDGLFGLDDRAFQILSALLPPEGPADERVLQTTIAQHLHHTPGWDQVGYPDDPLHRMKEIAGDLGVPSPPSSETIVRWIAGQRLAHAPGTVHRYTNIGYVVLARVIEAEAGVQYEDFVRDRVLAPAGVTRARLARNRREDRLPGEVQYQSFPHDIWVSIYEGEEGPVAEPAYGGLHLEGLDGSSAWVISAVDLVRLGAAVDGTPAIPDILSPEMLAFMRAPSPIGSYYGAGFAVASADQAAELGLPRIAFVEHSGGMPGTTSYFQVREDGLVMAVFFNADRSSFGAFVGDFVRVVNLVAEWPGEDLFSSFP